MNKISLKNALVKSLIAQLTESAPMSPAIVYENGEFDYGSALHGGTVIIDLQEGCGAFYIESASAAEFTSEQWLKWCEDDVQDRISEIENDA